MKFIPSHRSSINLAVNTASKSVVLLPKLQTKIFILAPFLWLTVYITNFPNFVLYPSFCMSSPDFHAVIVLHWSHVVHHFTYLATLLDPIKVPLAI